MRGLSRTRSAIAVVFAAVVFTLVGASAASAVVPGGLGDGLPEPPTSAACTSVAPGRHANGHRRLARRRERVRHVVDAVACDLQPRAGERAAHVSAVLPAHAVGGCSTFPLPIPPLSVPTAIAITPDGANVYVANSGNSTIHAFSRAADGSLALKPGSSRASPTPGGADPACARLGSHAQPAGPRRRGQSLYVASPGATAACHAARDRRRRRPGQSELRRWSAPQCIGDNRTGGRAVRSPVAWPSNGGNKLYAATAPGGSSRSTAIPRAGRWRRGARPTRASARAGTNGAPRRRAKSPAASATSRSATTARSTPRSSPPEASRRGL